MKTLIKIYKESDKWKYVVYDGESLTPFSVVSYMTLEEAQLQVDRLNKGV